MKRLTFEERNNFKFEFMRDFLIALGVVLTVSFFVYVNEVEASMFPIDAVEFRADVTGNQAGVVLHTLSPGETHTVLHESFNTTSQAVNGTLEIGCGALRLLYVHNFSNIPMIERPKNTICTSSITATTTGVAGGDITTLVLIGLDRDISLAGNANDIVGLAPLSANVVTFASTSPMTFIQDTMSNDLFNGFVLFFAVFFFIVWYFKRK